VVNRTRWWHLAACQGMDIRIFIPAANGNKRIRHTLKICAGCPVRPQCRDDMLELRPFGPVEIIAGGWRWDSRGHPTPCPQDAAIAHELILAAAARVARRGVAWPYTPRHLTGRAA